MARGYDCAICNQEIPVGSRNWTELSDGTIVHKECPDGSCKTCGDGPNDPHVGHIYRPA